MMKILNKPDKTQWKELTKRPAIDKKQLTKTAKIIIDDVKENGNKALIKYAELFDNVKLENIEVTKTEMQKAIEKIPNELKEAINLAHKNIYKFHKAQQISEEVIETMPGIKCWRKSTPIEKVGLYIPGGSAPLFSSILMLGIPAQIAGCKEIVMCTPPDKNQGINSAILYTAQLVGISKIYKVGGAQAIAAMAFGTETVPQAYKIFGPGNQYVTKAKELIQQNGIAIDMPAGPSELLVVADNTRKPMLPMWHADLLSHKRSMGADSQVIIG